MPKHEDHARLESMSEERAYSLRRRIVGRGQLSDFGEEIGGVIKNFHGDALGALQKET